MPSESQWLFGDGLSKRISENNNMKGALNQSFWSYRQNNGRYYNSSSHSGYSYSSQQKMKKTSSPPGGSQFKRERVRS